MSTEVIQDEDESILAYISGPGQQPFLDERNLMTTPTSPATGLETTTLYYRFDGRRAPIDPLERFSVPGEYEMEADPASFLERYRYKLLAKVNDSLSYYRSDEATDAEYLALVQTSDAAGVQYRLVFHIYDDKSWIAFKARFESYLHRILAQPGILPSPQQPYDRDMQVIHLDARAVRNMTNGFY